MENDKRIAEINMGLLCSLEDLLGTERLQRMMDMEDVSCSFKEKQQLMQIVTGRKEVDHITIEEAEETLGFFLISLAVSTERGKTKLLFTLLLNLMSKPEILHLSEALARTSFPTEGITNILLEHSRRLKKTQSGSDDSPSDVS